MSDSIPLTFKFRLGDKVRFASHARRVEKQVGRVMAREYYEEPGACGQWYIVQWLSDEPDHPIFDRLPEFDLVSAADK